MSDKVKKIEKEIEDLCLEYATVEDKQKPVSADLAIKEKAKLYKTIQLGQVKMKIIEQKLEKLKQQLIKLH